MLRPAVAALILAPLVACGGAGDAGTEPDAVGPALIEVFWPLEVPGGGDGWTDWSDPAAALVYVKASMDPATWIVVVHELLHALGLREHEASDECWLHAPPLPTLATLCDSERARLAAVYAGVPSVVVVMDEAARESVEYAAAWLNDDFGAALLTVAPP